MGVAGHDGVEVLFRHIAERFHDGLAARARLFDLVGEVEAQIERHLIVAAAGGMQFLARLADAAGQFALHEGVDVLAGHVDLQLACVDVGEDALKACDDSLLFLLGEYADFAQHARVGDGAGDVLLVHARVKADDLLRRSRRSSTSPPSLPCQSFI